MAEPFDLAALKARAQLCVDTQDDFLADMFGAEVPATVLELHAALVRYRQEIELATLSRADDDRDGKARREAYRRALAAFDQAVRL